MKAVNATCNMHGDEIILEYHFVTIILQTSPWNRLTRSDLPIGARPPRTERTRAPASASELVRFA